MTNEEHEQLMHLLTEKDEHITELEKENRELQRRTEYALKTLQSRNVESDVIYVLRNG